MQWWAMNLSFFNIINFDLPGALIYTDAYLLSFGATYNGHSAGWHWSIDEPDNHINVLQMRGNIFVLKVYCTRL